MKLNINKKPEDLERERNEKRRKMEAEIQRSSLERQAKLQAMKNKQKMTKILLIFCFCVISLALIVFGTYNTFFKHIITMDEVEYAIALNKDRYNSSGINEYLQTNCQTIFSNYATFDASKYDYAEVDPTSVYIVNIAVLSNDQALVRYGFNVNVKEKDILIEDEDLIQKLRRNGFFNVDDNDTDTNTDIDTASETDAVATATDADAEQETSNMVYGVNVSDNGSENSYYTTSNGAIMQRGKITSCRYIFEVFINYYAETYTDETTGEEKPTGNYGYKISSTPTLYSLESININNFESNPEAELKNQFLTFTPEDGEDNQPVDENTLDKVKIQVDKAFADVYAGRDTGAQIRLNKKFNTYANIENKQETIYKGITSFEMYEHNNAVGCNAKVTYEIETYQGIRYTVTYYLLVTNPSGNVNDTWIIEKII